MENGFLDGEENAFFCLDFLSFSLFFSFFFLFFLLSQTNIKTNIKTQKEAKRKNKNLEFTDVLVLHHNLKELDDDLGAGANHNLALAASLGVDNRDQGIVKNTGFHHCWLCGRKKGGWVGAEMGKEERRGKETVIIGPNYLNSRAP